MGSTGSDTACAIDELREVAPGTAYVASVVVQAHETLVRLGYPFGREVVVRVPDVPHPGEDQHPSSYRRILAVQVRNTPAGVECSVLGTSWSGPLRLPISLTQALALAESGVHTVFLTA